MACDAMQRITPRQVLDAAVDLLARRRAEAALSGGL